MSFDRRELIHLLTFAAGSGIAGLDSPLAEAFTPSSLSDSPWRTEAGITIFSPFPEASHYFGDPKQMWMVNFRVRDLDKMATQLRAAGIAVDVDPKVYPNGRFARIHDPEGNPIELWQPAG
jgi:catechol 2,3-dioxygenase-like lactoylglutathione lyase family enzyme